MPTDTDVIVVGAGPTGLLLAGDLASLGVRCALVERRAGESNLTRAFAVHARTLELLDARGLADELLATGSRVRQLRILNSAAVSLADLPTRFPFALVTPQYETERLLERRALAAGVDIRAGVEVRGLRQDDTGVDLDVRLADGSAATLRAGYAVGTDGVRSTVRRALGLPFPGRSVVRSMMLADVRLTDPPDDVLNASVGDRGFAFLAPFGDGWYRAIAWDARDQQPDDADVELDEIRGVFRRVHGTDFGMHGARWLSRFHSDERQAPRYRVGRAFLAGDAAHVHSPAGGQGMNTGLQDAANLGWKLAAAVHGHAPAWLLDSYQAERHPVGTAVLRGSGALLRLGLGQSLPLRVARAVGTAVAGRGLVPRKAASTAISGLGIRYAHPRGTHPSVGRRMPDIAVEPTASGARRLYEVLRGGRFVLVTCSDHDGELAGWADRVAVVRPSRPNATTVLVRPDGYVAWAADEPTAGLADACMHWLGDRAPAVTSAAASGQPDLRRN
ncbi:MAG: FAD-dependent monooxygenase [Streptosporangiales bacterium]|nr:FAD-dependent monooxygenase [Streptosporangiales bacterium]MBO0889644.1 FAD-dependent monooxygenase [Acidothermales bacterium]